jgi:hypothetical protein
MLSAREAMLTTRFSVFRGLGACAAGSFDDACFGSVTESMEDRLALFPWLPLIMYDAALDRLLGRSGTSGVAGPDRIDRAELRETIEGRMTCEAPFRYDRCAHSLVGDGDRSWPGARFGCSGSGDIDMGDGVRFGGLVLTSETVSAWKNLLSCCDLLIVDKGGDAFSGLRGASSCLPLA